jgi:hypothetical protein
MGRCVWKTFSEPFPCLAANPSLLEYPGEQFATDISLMRVRDENPDLVLHHVLVVAPRVWPAKACPPEVADQVISTDWPKGGHYPGTLVTLRSMPLTTGKG